MPHAEKKCPRWRARWEMFCGCAIQMRVSSPEALPSFLRSLRVLIMSASRHPSSTRDHASAPERGSPGAVMEATVDEGAPFRPDSPLPAIYLGITRRRGAR